MVEHYRLIRVGQSEVLLGFLGHQSLSTVADDFLDQASSRELKKKHRAHTDYEDSFHPHDDTLVLQLLRK